MSDNFAGVMKSYHNLVSTLRDARRLHKQCQNVETRDLERSVSMQVEELENKIIDLKLRSDNNDGPRDWIDADMQNNSLILFDPNMTQLLEKPSEDWLNIQVGMGTRPLGQVNAVVNGVTYRFSTVLQFDEYNPDVYRYHTLMTLNGEDIDERQGTDYDYAADYGDMLRDIICEEDDDSDDPSNDDLGDDLIYWRS